MASLKNILVPTDFSAEANNALEIAVEIAFQADATITLLHVIDVPQGASGAQSMNVLNYAPHDDQDVLRQRYMMELMKTVKSKLDALVAKHSKVKIDAHIKFDRLQQHVSDFVAQEETDFIVMGTKGSNSTFNSFTVGSNTQKVVRESAVPVLAIKEKDDSFLVRNIVCATTANGVSEAAIKTLKFFQVFFGATLHFVQVVTRESFEPSSHVMQTMKEFVEEHDFSNYTLNIFNHFTEAQGITAFGKTVNGDMIAMSTHGRSGMGHMLLGSITEELSDRTKLPVLTFPYVEEEA